MKNISLPIITLSLAVVFCPTSYGEAPPVAAVMTKERQQAMTPRDAMQRLKEGNDRFVAGRPLHRDLLAEAEQTASGQHPYAAIV